MRHDAGSLPVHGTIDDLDPSKLTCGIEIKTTNRNDTAIDLDARVPWIEVKGKEVAGTCTWRLGFNQKAPEIQTLMQVWLYNLVYEGKKELLKLSTGSVPGLTLINHMRRTRL